MVCNGLGLVCIIVPLRDQLSRPSQKTGERRMLERVMAIRVESAIAPQSQFGHLRLFATICGGMLMLAPRP